MDKRLKPAFPIFYQRLKGKCLLFWWIVLILASTHCTFALSNGCQSEKSTNFAELLQSCYSRKRNYFSDMQATICNIRQRHRTLKIIYDEDLRVIFVKNQNDFKDLLCVKLQIDHLVRTQDFRKNQHFYPLRCTCDSSGIFLNTEFFCSVPSRQLHVQS